MDFETVRSMIAEQLKVDPDTITPESRLMEDLKADSANIMVMIMDMEDRFGITVEDDQIMKLKTVGDVAEYIAKVKGCLKCQDKIAGHDHRHYYGHHRQNVVRDGQKYLLNGKLQVMSKDYGAKSPG